MGILSSSTTATFDGPVNGLAGLEAKLRQIFGEQHRLRELLDRTLAELDEVNRKLLQFQAEYCTDDTRDEEYNQCLEKILGFDPRIDPKDLEAARGSRPMLGEIIEELERQCDLAEGVGKA